LSEKFHLAYNLIYSREETFEFIPLTRPLLPATRNMEFTVPDGIKTFHTKPYPLLDVTRPELSTAGKVVLITGGGSGLGLVFAEHFAKAGSKTIAITGRRQNILEKAKQSVESKYPGTKVLTLPGDVANRAAVDAAFENTKDTFGPVDILINNAGFDPEYGLISEETSDDEWWRAFETNVKGSHNVLAAFVQGAAHDATVINVTSATVNTVLSHQSAYSSSKVASTRLFEVFQLENPNYRVVNVAPGIVQTAMLDITLRFFEKQGWPQLPIDDSKFQNSKHAQSKTN
jgi:NAD(P)-dependent dehydrogenase (short-subunit alcohol dehydrogenase family)